MAAVSVKRSIETINTFIHSRKSLENQTRFQTKMGKVYTYFQTKKAQNPTRWGGTYLYGLYKGVTPARVLSKHNFRCNVKIPSKMTRYLKASVKLLASGDYTLLNTREIPGIDALIPRPIPGVGGGREWGFQLTSAQGRCFDSGINNDN